MRQPGGEVPKVAGADVIDKETALLVKERDAAATFDYVAPLGFLVPVQLADAAGFKAHVYARDLRADRQLACRRLAGPAAGEDAVVRQRKRPLEIRHRAGVGSGRDQRVGVLALDGHVARANDGCAAVAHDRLGVAITVLSYLSFLVVGLDTHV